MKVEKIFFAVLCFIATTMFSGCEQTDSNRFNSKVNATVFDNNGNQLTVQVGIAMEEIVTESQLLYEDLCTEWSLAPVWSPEHDSIIGSSVIGYYDANKDGVFNLKFVSYDKNDPYYSATQLQEYLASGAKVTLTFSKEGYGTAIKTITLYHNETLNLEVILD